MRSRSATHSCDASHQRKHDEMHHWQGMHLQRHAHEARAEGFVTTATLLLLLMCKVGMCSKFINNGMMTMGSL